MTSASLAECRQFDPDQVRSAEKKQGTGRAACNTLASVFVLSGLESVPLEHNPHLKEWNLRECVYIRMNV